MLYEDETGIKPVLEAMTELACMGPGVTRGFCVNLSRVEIRKRSDFQKWIDG
jgi:hypothetical protein